MSCRWALTISAKAGAIPIISHRKLLFLGLVLSSRAQLGTGDVTHFLILDIKVFKGNTNGCYSTKLCSAYGLFSHEYLNVYEVVNKRLSVYRAFKRIYKIIDEQ